MTFKPRHMKTNVLHMRKQRRKSAAQLISAFVFAAQILQSPYFLKPKFQASSHLVWSYSPVCVGPGRKPECWFSHDEAHLIRHAILFAVKCRFIMIIKESFKNPTSFFLKFNTTCYPMRLQPCYIYHASSFHQ